jgi:hypothetical protein
MSEPGPVEPGYGGDIARISDRLAALERLGLTPRGVGDLIPYAGPLPVTTGEVEVQPGCLLANGTKVSLTRWPELIAIEGLYGTASTGLVQLPNIPASGDQTGTLIYAGRKAVTAPAFTLAGTPVTFTIAAGTDDGFVGANFTSTTWRPPTAGTADATDNDLLVDSNKSGANYANWEALLRWDTSSLDDAAVISGAVLRFWATTVIDNDIRSVIAEWYESGAITTGDYTATPGTNAHEGHPLSGLVVDDYNDLLLIGADANVNRTGFTGLRLAISDPAPVLQNRLMIAAFEDPVATPPQLIVYVA